MTMAQEAKGVKCDVDNKRIEYPYPEILATHSLTMGTGLYEELTNEQQIRDLIKQRKKQAQEQGTEINFGTIILAMQRAHIQTALWKENMGIPKEYIDQDLEFAEQDIPRIVREELL